MFKRRTCQPPPLMPPKVNSISDGGDVKGAADNISKSFIFHAIITKESHVISTTLTLTI